MQVLRVESVSKSFGGLNVLGDVDFALESGEKVALIGPNGAGKTTLLNVIGGQLPTSSGDVWFDERRITPLPPNKRLHLGLGRRLCVSSGPGCRLASRLALFLFIGRCRRGKRRR